MTTTAEPLVAGAIRAHNTDTSDGEWDADANRAHLPSESSALREAHAWVDADGDTDAKTRHKLLHHEVAADGTVGPANMDACLAGIHALNRAASVIPETDRAGAYAHLRNHLRSGGRPEATIPELRGKAEAGAEGAVTAAADEGDEGEEKLAPMTDKQGTPYRRWRMPVAVLEGVWTGDNRMIEANALTWRELPRPLMAKTVTSEGHIGAKVVGRIDRAERVDASAMVDARTGEPYGEGAYAVELEGVFLNDEFAAEIAELIEGQFLRGVSVDMTDATIRLELYGADGEPLDVESADEESMLGATLREIYSAVRISEATVTPTEAIEAAYIELIDDDGNAGPATKPGRPTREEQTAGLRASSEFTPRRCLPCETDGLTAAAAPVEPPLEWFLDPALDGPTPITVDDDGRVYGHLADWSTCHTGITGRCVKPPRSTTGYAVFRTGAVHCSDGTLVAVGQLTVGTSHASTDRGTDALATMRHYDHTGTAVADVSVGEDEFGIWVAGALRPDATPEQVRVLRASPLSGDWRPWGDGLELVAALAVNVPGFPVVRQVVASGRTTALIASGPAPRTTPAELDEVRRLLPVLTAAAARELAAQEAEDRRVREWAAAERAAGLRRAMAAAALRVKAGAT